MSNHNATTGDNAMIGRDFWDVPVRVELRAYLRFNRRMDRQLRRLVVRWAHAASPWARGIPPQQPQFESHAPPIL